MRFKNLFGASSALGTGKARKLRAPLLGLTLAMATSVLLAAPASAASTTTVYDATPNPTPPNVASLGFQATQTSEFGDYVILDGTERRLESVTVTMSDWALFSDYSSDPRYMHDPANWTHPITVSVYDDSLGVNGEPDELLASTTETITIPWRPVADNTCTNPTAWRASDNICYSGKAFDATFDLSSSNVTLPDEVIVGVAFNTQSYGSTPEGVAGPYNSLNVGVPANQTAAVGTDEDVDAVFWNTAHAPNYTDGGLAGTGTFREDTAWTPNGTVAFEISTATTLDGCLVDVSGSSPTVYTLLADCTTDHTIIVPQHAGGTVFDGNGYSITGVDPVGGHFKGAVIQAQAGSNHMTVKNTTVQTSNLQTACDAGIDRLRGILFDDARGLIDSNVVTNIEQGANGDGCQEGNAIEARNEPFDKTGMNDLAVLITNNVISQYQKSGIVANGSVAATIRNNSVTGDGPINYIAQNGIQVGFGATAVVKMNSSSGNNYTPKSDIACGFLIYQADGVSASGNNFFNNERNQCNFGKGGGTFKPATP